MSMFRLRRHGRSLLPWLGWLGLPWLSVPAIALSTSVGADGINALRLHAEPYNITGDKIGLGQVEIGRPGQFGLDKVVPGLPPVQVGHVFFRDTDPRPNQEVDSHAAYVASVMVSQDKLLQGVAPGARLYAAAVGSLQRSGQPEECLASQHVATRNGDDVRAINFSFGEPLFRDERGVANAVLDGNALLTQCIDWSSRVHDTLYVIAGNQGRGGIPIPTDNFNGLNVASSTAIDGVFSKLDFSNLGSEPAPILSRSPRSESNEGARRSINIVAPGNGISLIGADGRTQVASGTSFAAPHVAATVALIQEYGDRQLVANRDDWSLASREPQVSKAVLLNSADKLQDPGSGIYLGMERTLRDESNQDWLVSDAYATPAIPLHADMGTGHLNAFRAYQQFAAGQWAATAPVPAMGWDYATVGQGDGVPVSQDYVIETPLEAGSFISVTLAWDRLVELQDTNRNNQYDVGESFRDRGLNDLNIYLMRVEDDDSADSVWASTSLVDSTEHLFYPIPETGQYKIRVVYERQANQPSQDYAIAWWAKE